VEERQRVLEETQRIAGVGSWEVDLATGSVTVSDEYVRQVRLDRDELREKGLEFVLAQRVAPDDMARVRAALAATIAGSPMDLVLTLAFPDSAERVVRVRGEVVRDEVGTPVRLRGSNQDVTEARRAQERLAAVAAGQEAAAREHLIADQLQRSLLPGLTFDPDRLRVATFYRAGVEGTQVGGDWYDVIELGAGRTGLVMGDVMGRGVRAAAVMGQLRAAVRAYARLDLPPADILEFLDGAVRELGEDQIVTCVYAVYDPGERSLTYANAGHLPPLLRAPGERTVRLTTAAGPPLGAGPLTITEHRVQLEPGAVLVLYTDGLVEHRDSDLDVGIDALAAALPAPETVVDGALPDALVAALLPAGQDDDVAVLVAQVHDDDPTERSVAHHVLAEDHAVQDARRLVRDALDEWGCADQRSNDIVLLASELVTNAVIHGRPPIELRLRASSRHVVLEVHDRASLLPRRLRPTTEDEHGRGIQLVAMLADRWGTRPVPGGKAVWCVFGLDA
jgi:serine phosphatase RsbU (regulator of sigma subunit)/anti-sigma regulatory factor (Ser/Thr protein kinase)